jgi:MoaA/NifB/PqqE/SkfB family radical SAM enzyme
VIGAVRRFFAHNLHLTGIVRGRALIGPWAVQIDPTVRCDNRCVGCWVHSPHGTREPDLCSELDFERLREVLRELRELGTRMIYVSGGGEPFCYPRIWDLLATIREEGMDFSVHTNLGWARGESLDRLLALGPQQVTVSLWASNPEVYARTNPEAPPGRHEQVVERLRRLAGRPRRPVVKLHTVILSLNAEDLEPMAQLARSLGVDALEVALLDVVPGCTDGLAVSGEQREELSRVVERLLRDPPLRLEGLDVVARWLAADGRPDRDALLAELFPCYAGYFASRITARGDVLYCLKAHRRPVGNIGRQSFREIWFGAEMAALRRAGAAEPPDLDAFAFIGNRPVLKPGCLAGCDDLPVNRLLRERLARFRGLKRALAAGPWAGWFAPGGTNRG